MGRKTKLDDIILLPAAKKADGSDGGSVPRRRADVIVERVKAGIPNETAAESSGVDISTFYRWMEAGADRWEGGRLVRGREPYRGFRDAVIRARAEAEAAAVAIVQRAASDDWRAAAWYLERSRPQRWRRRDTVHQAGPAEGDPSPAPTRVEHTLADDAPSKLADLLDLVERAGSRPPAGPGEGGPS